MAEIQTTDTTKCWGSVKQQQLLHIVGTIADATTSLEDSLVYNYKIKDTHTV